jgi:hypothetical protein
VNNQVNVLRAGRLKWAVSFGLLIKEPQLARQLIAANRREQRSAAAANFQKFAARKIHQSSFMPA